MMQRQFESKKYKDSKLDNTQSIFLLAKPRMDFIDDEYKRIQPLINKVLEKINNLNENTGKTKSAIVAEIKANLSDFENLYKELIKFRKIVLQLPEYTGNDSLYYALKSYERAIDNIKKDQFYMSVQDALGCTTKNFENIDAQLRETIVSQKEIIVIDLQERLLTRQKSKNVLSMETRLVAMHNHQSDNPLYSRSTLQHLSLSETPIITNVKEISSNDIVLYIMHTTSCRTALEIDKKRFEEVQERAKRVFIILMKIQNFNFGRKYDCPIEDVDYIEVHLNPPSEATTKCCQFLKFTSASANLAPWVSDDNNQEAYEEIQTFLKKEGLKKSYCMIL